MAVNKTMLSKMSNVKNLQFHKDIDSAVERLGGWEKFKVERYKDRYKQCISVEEKAIKYEAKSLITEHIRVANKLRENLFVGFSKIVCGNIYHYDAKFVAAAKRIKLSWNKYGQVIKLSLPEETAAISVIIAKLENELKDDVELLGIDGWVAKLKDANNTVEALMSNRDDEGAAKFDVPMKEARMKSDNVCVNTVQLLKDWIVAGIETAGTDELLKVIDEIAERNR